MRLSSQDLQEWLSLNVPLIFSMNKRPVWAHDFGEKAKAKGSIFPTGGKRGILRRVNVEYKCLKLQERHCNVTI